jgi:Heavy metal binding domain
MNFLRLLLVPLFAVALIFITADVYSAFTTTQNGPPAQSKKPDQVYYVCPMHGDVRYKKPGLCPKCKMKLERKLPPEK